MLESLFELVVDIFFGTVDLDIYDRFHAFFEWLYSEPKNSDGAWKTIETIRGENLTDKF